jgi:hypothetical protein
MNLSKIKNLLLSKYKSISFRTNSALNVFSKTINELEKINEDIILTEKIKSKQLSEIECELLFLNTIKSENETIISKIKHIIE